jgi:hypothetical protein
LRIAPLILKALAGPSLKGYGTVPFQYLSRIRLTIAAIGGWEVHGGPPREVSMPMDSAYLAAFAALTGSVIGGVTSLASAWLTQNWQQRAMRLERDKATRQALYKQFIDEASKLYADALVHHEAGILALSSIYAMINRMRVLSSSAVVEKAETVARVIVETYFAPDKTFPDLLALIDSQTIDPLRAFSQECRAELQAAKGF